MAICCRRFWENKSLHGELMRRLKGTCSIVAWLCADDQARLTSSLIFRSRVSNGMDEAERTSKSSCRLVARSGDKQLDVNTQRLFQRLSQRRMPLTY